MRTTAIILCIRLSGEVLEHQHKEDGEVFADRDTHSTLLSEYKALLTTKKQSARKALECIRTPQEAHFDEIFGQMVPVCYLYVYNI